MRIVFVCTGNICRSPMAEYMFRAMLEEEEALDPAVTSAGVSALPGRPASPPAVKVLAEAGIDGIEGHRARPVSSLNLGDQDHLLTMTRSHLSRLSSAVRERTAAAAVLKDFVGGSGGFSDPYGGDVARYRSLRNELDPVLRKLLDKLRPPGNDSDGSTLQRGGR